MTPRRRSLLAATALAAFLATPNAGRAQDDTDLFTVSVPPNVVVILDNSGSMNHIVWHPAFDPAATPAGCNFWDNNGTYFLDQADGDAPSGPGDTRFGPGTYNRCGNIRTVFVDPVVQNASGDNDTRWSGRYLNWYFSDAADAFANEILTATGTYSACVQNDFGITNFSRFRRARVSAAQDVMREVVCNINQAGKVRFGLAEFRLPGGSNDPNGGYVLVPIQDFDTPPYSLNGSPPRTHLQHFSNAIDALEADSWTPLGETLFQTYTYLMSRNSADRPNGVGGGTFPKYSYQTNTTGNFGDFTNNNALIPPDPVQFACQKNFVVIITDGEPTKDDFDSSNGGSTAQGFNNFMSLIGDFNPDGQVEGPGGLPDPPWLGTWESTRFLDDIARFMHETDFRPDLDGNQTIDVYTVGFTTPPHADDVLRDTATAGGGLFFSSNNPEELSAALIATVTDIVEKSQSFTAATVPATRTADGGNIYTSLFVPSDSPYWEGQLKLFQIDPAGDILDANGNCALLNPSPPGECKSGSIAPSAVPFWDAANEIPTSPSRSLSTSLPGSGKVPFDSTLTATALGDPGTAADDLSAADISSYPGSGATTVEELADTIIENVRGCELGTGVSNSCVDRASRLGDIFHSNPLVVGRPRSFINENSYRMFRDTFATRDNIIYAGSNAGFVQGFHAGDWQATPLPPATPGYDRGTGEEVFGFMPWPVRQNARFLPIDSGSRDYYGVDGSPAAADVWLHSTPTQTVKAADGSEWRTVLAGGLRQGGRAYYALDISDPSSGSYPGYLWEFPREDDPAAVHAFMGETWGQPVMTKVRVQIGGQPYERWVAIVSGGYDRRSDPNDALNYDPNATAGRAIYILDLKTGQVLGEKKFTPGATDGQQDMLYAMPSTPSVFDTDLDGYADVIYIGDLGGNVWKWVLDYDPAFNNFLVDPINSVGSTAQPDTKFRKFFEAKATPASPLGVTVGGTTYFKSIFFSPAGAFSLNRFWLAFGTGERTNLQRTHETSTTAENNRYYSVKDEDIFDRRTTPIPTLTEQDLLDTSDSATCPNLASQSGFFFRVDDDEKFVTESTIFGFWVIAASFTPSGVSDPCSASGNGRLYVFKVHCGQGFFFDTATATSTDLASGGPGGSGGSANPALADFGDPESRYLDLGAGLPTDPRVTVGPGLTGGGGAGGGGPGGGPGGCGSGGNRVFVTQQDGVINNLEAPDSESCAPGQLYWRER